MEEDITAASVSEQLPSYSALLLSPHAQKTLTKIALELKRECQMKAPEPVDAHPLMCAGPATSSEATVLIQTNLSQYYWTKIKSNLSSSLSLCMYVYIYIKKEN